MPQPVSLQNVISDVLREFGLDKKARDYSLLTDWARIVGEKIASATVAEKLEKGVLTIRVKNAVWRHELSMQKASIIEKIASELGPGLVRDIQWRI
jgi:predicted nucleic acid-binding Zn ribbon protein